MPALKSRMIFISHAWKYSSHYETLVSWLDDASNFKWKNCSVPSDDSLPNKTAKGLREGITRQINPSQIIIILGGMYAAHSGWIEYEIEEAKRLGKPIIGVKPWGQENTAKIVQDASCCPMVGWNRGSVIDAIRENSW